jgi:hypothetical protein
MCRLVDILSLEFSFILLEEVGVCHHTPALKDKFYSAERGGCRSFTRSLGNSFILLE